MEKKFVCLANSRKHLEHCIAGREISDGITQSWFRPISERPSHGISLDERKYQNQTEPTLGDIISLTTKNHVPHEFQTENWVFDKGYWWEKHGVADWDYIKGLAENPPTLWLNGSSTHEGLNDQISHQNAKTLNTSLCMIHVGDMQFRVCTPGVNFGDMRKRVQSQFTHRGVRYWMWMTDAVLEPEYQKRSNQQYPIGECCVTVSLSEPHLKQSDGQHYVYKLAAGIMLPT